ncbi:mycothiol transferase [Glutamicibacter nicotianae]
MNSSVPVQRVLVQLLLEKFDQLVDIVNGIPDELVNFTLPAQASNSPVQILVHCCGMMRRWSSTVNLGVAVPRDRDAEFSAQMEKQDALKLADATRTAFIADLSHTRMHLPPAATPPSRESDYWMATCEGVLLHVFEELCQHLGHLEITRDVLVLPAS